MFRFLLAMLFAASALQATSVAFSSCTAGTTTISPCGGDVFTPGFGIVGPDYSAVAGVSASDDSDIPGLPSLSDLFLPTIPSGSVMSVGAAAAVSSSGPSPALSATALARASNVFYSAGAPRSGFIQFDVRLDRAHGGTSNALLSDGTHQYSYDVLGSGSTPSLFCDIDDCGWTATVPFDLGSEFRVSAFAGVEVSLPTSHGYEDGIVVFRLLESDGTTPVPFSATPEPASWGLLLFGLAGACFVSRKRIRG
jgi:hypothetical protein